MKNYTYKKIKELNYKALNLYPNLRDFLLSGEEVSDIMDAIEADMKVNPNDKKELTNFLNENQDFFQGNLFNWMNEYDFIEYCKDIYADIYWYDELIEKHWVR